MPMEQEPIKIVIPVEDETVVLVPERRTPDLNARLREGAPWFRQQAQSAWESQERQRAQAHMRAAVRQGLSRSRLGVVYGLRWLSRRMAALAERFTPLDEQTGS